MRDFIQYIKTLAADDDILSWSGYMPHKNLSNSQSVAFYDLPPVIRALLIADGTVTMTLEAVFKEPIAVNTLHQQPLELASAPRVFPVAETDDLLFRDVELVGKHSGTHYVRAYSVLRRSAIDAGLWRDLIDGVAGIGAVLRHASQANYRKVIHIGMGDLASENDRQVHRSYCVYLADQPAILITEVFNLMAFDEAGL